jgi:O-antigen/teichoic acid export membrane protein
MIAFIKAGIRRVLPSNTFARGVSVLVAGTAGAQALSVLAAPLLTRLYSPEDFGLLAVFSGMLALISVISSLRYELAIPLPEDNEEAAHLVILSLLILLGTTIMTTIAVIFFGDMICSVLGVPSLQGYLWLLPVGVMLAGTYNVFLYWTTRNKAFNKISGTRLHQAIATIVIQLTAYKLGGIALLLGQLAGSGMVTAGLARPALVLPVFKRLRWKTILDTAHRYRRFPIITSWSGLVNSAGHQLPPLLFAALFSPAAAGLYALSNRLLMLPATLIGQAIANVFFANGAETHRRGALGPLVQSIQKQLIQIGFPPIFIVAVIGPDLFHSVFGEEWRQAGELARWLTIGIFSAFVISPVSTTFVVIEKQGIGLTLQLNLFSLRLLAVLIGASSGSLLLTTVLFSLASSVGYLCYFYAISYLLRTDSWMLIKSLIKTFLSSVFIAFPLVVPYFVGDESIIIICSSLATLVLFISYYFYLWSKWKSNAISL